MKFKKHFMDNKNTILKKFRVPKTNVFILGCLEARVTFLSQQRRALNLVDAMISAGIVKPSGRICIVGGGASGITAASAFCIELPELTVDLYESAQEILHFQEMSDRYLHPHLYDWPRRGSDIVDARLPILNWEANEASKIATKIKQEFEGIIEDSKVKIHKSKKVTNIFTNELKVFVELENASRLLENYDAAILASIKSIRMMQLMDEKVWFPQTNV